MSNKIVFLGILVYFSQLFFALHAHADDKDLLKKVKVKLYDITTVRQSPMMILLVTNESNDTVILPYELMMDYAYEASFARKDGKVFSNLSTQKPGPNAARNNLFINLPSKTQITLILPTPASIIFTENEIDEVLQLKSEVIESKSHFYKIKRIKGGEIDIKPE